MTHFLKSWPDTFEAILEGRKLHEVRHSNDRNFLIGDYLILQEWDPEKFYMQLSAGKEKEEASKAAYTGRKTMRKVTYITPKGSWGLPKDVCVMSIK